MTNPIYKTTWNGHGIYWYPKQGYGDETRVLAPTMAECRDMIDRQIALDRERRPDHLKYWDGLQPEERDKWRKLCIETELSASELAYTHRESEDTLR